MGQAKKRGTREQRIAQAIERADEAHCARLEADARRKAESEAYLASLPPEHRQTLGHHERRGGAWMMVAAALASAGLPHR